METTIVYYVTPIMGSFSLRHAAGDWGDAFLIA